VPWSVLRFVLQEDWRDLQTNVRDFGPAWAGRPAVFAQGDLTQNGAGNLGGSLSSCLTRRKGN